MPTNLVIFIFLKTLQNASDVEKKSSVKVENDALVGSLWITTTYSKDNSGNY